MLGPLLRKKSKLWDVELPPNSIEEFEKRLQAGRQRYGRFFEDPEQCDYLCMLPVSEAEREQILRNMIKHAQLVGDVRNCEGVPDSSPEHRQLCVACVANYKPTVATSYY